MENFFESLRAAPEQEWLDGVTRSADVPREWHRCLPPLPSESLQRDFVGRVGPAAFAQAVSYLGSCQKLAFQHGAEFSATNTVFDFGCGWGRITQCLLRYFSPDSIVAGDPNPRAMELVDSYRIFPKALLTSVLPPTMLDTESLDFIFAYSVFSHLSEQATIAWFEEFSRLLRPGGIVFFTTRNHQILDWASQLSVAPNGDLSTHQKQLVTAYRNRGEIEDRLACGEMWWHPIGKVGTHYGEAIVPRKFVAARLQPILGGKWEYVDQPAGMDQALVSVQKINPQ